MQTPIQTYEVDALVIGAGVVGLAAARALALAGRNPLVLDKNAGFGEETSARNSEVIHAGIYYPAGSLKAHHCVAGKHRLYRYCEERGIAHRRCTKLIVASEAEEVAALEGIAARARANGVDDLELLDGAQVRALEPEVRAEAALLSPSTGIVDSHALMLALLGDLEAHGGTLATHTEIAAGQVRADGTIECVLAGEEAVRLVTPCLVNAAGLWAPSMTRRIEGLPPPPDLALVKGNYFALSGRAPFTRLVYPVPRDGGLGIHYTLDLAGRGRFGPDTEWLGDNDPAALDYGVAPERGAAFEAAIRRYWPGLEAGALTPDYAGVRPKLAGERYPDFRLDGPETHSLGQHVLLYGIESPGLTAALSLGEAVAEAAAGGSMRAMKCSERSNSSEAGAG
ncbi:MAG: NAD(P)/FAD-dependent oxidoreductase [Pseudomonadota bacterium]